MIHTSPINLVGKNLSQKKIDSNVAVDDLFRGRYKERYNLSTIEYDSASS